VALGWKRSIARAAVAEAAAHVGLVATLDMLIREALDRAAASPPDQALDAQARATLVGLGWSAAIARVAVDEALSRVGSEVTLETVIREALRRCAKRQI